MKVIKAAVLVDDEMRPKDLSTLLDLAFEDVPEVVQFTLEGYGVDSISEVTEQMLWDRAVETFTNNTPQGAAWTFGY